MTVKIFVAIALFSFIAECFSIGHKGQTTNCQQYTTNLLNVLTLMCTNIANGTNETLQDACIGCFQAASFAENNQPSLPQLSSCATKYLTNTNYSSCIDTIQSVAAYTGTTSTGKCLSDYCPFVQCIRHFNSNILIARCYNMSIENNNGTTDRNHIRLYRNITSCILAIARCSSINPITGDPQTANLITTTIYNKWKKAVTTTTTLHNAVQITPAGRLRIISIPDNIPVRNYFCSAQANLQESTWKNYTCN